MSREQLQRRYLAAYLGAKEAAALKDAAADDLLAVMADGESVQLAQDGKLYTIRKVFTPESFRFDSARYKKEHPEALEEYQVPTKAKRYLTVK